MNSLRNYVRELGACALAMIFFSGFALADTLTGTVTNKTTNKPSAGDEVVLIRLEQGMQELTRAKTDAKGQFTLQVPDQNMHLVRVTHDGASYFRPAPAGAESIEVDVYNAAAKVKGVTSEADVMRIQTDESGKSLRVVENFFVKNESNPPTTQFGDRPFEFYLPAGAVVQGAAALSPGGMPVQASPVPVGDAGHFAFVFPVRPGETRFQVTYSLPYDGSKGFAPKPMMQTDTIAVMMPKSMTFKAVGAAAYISMTEETTAQTYVARNVAPSQPVEFTVSGTGQLPRETPAAGPDASAGTANAGGAAGGASASATDTRPGGGLGVPIDAEGTTDPWSKYRWWIVGGLGLAMAAGAGFMLKSGGGATAPAMAGAGVPAAGFAGGAGVSGVMPGYGVPASAPAGSALLAALKDELFALETDRLQGKLSETDFVEQKAALEVVLRRALARTGGEQS